LGGRVRPDSLQQISIGGHQAVAAIADFKSRGDGKPRVECLTWILTPGSRIFFFATIAPDRFAVFQPEFDRIVRSATLL
jgi:hypothetical protein